MVAIIIIISSVSLALLLNKLMKPGIMSYLLPVLLSFLFGVLLFYIGFSINAFLFYLLAGLPLIILLFLVFKRKVTK